MQFIGMTRQSLMKWFKYYNKLRLEDMKFKAKLAGAQFKEDKSGRMISDEEAALRISNPLWNWPDDIDYLSIDEINERIVISKELDEKHKAGLITLTEEQILCLWTNEYGRIDSAMGKVDQAAKRAAHVDPLWLKYVQWKQKHGRCTLDRLKWFVECDQFLKPLYPLCPEGQKLLAQHPDTVVSPDVPPPVWWIDHLKEKGTFKEHMDKYQSVLTRKVQD